MFTLSQKALIWTHHTMKLELVFVPTHRRSRRVVSEVVVSCEVNPKHGLPHVLYFRAVDCPPPTPHPYHYAPRLALATQPFSSHPLAIVYLFLSVSSVRVFCLVIHISGQNIKPYPGYLPANINFKYGSYWGCVRIGWWGEYLGLRGTRQQRSGEKYIMRNLTICTPHPILFGWLNREERDGRGM